MLLRGCVSNQCAQGERSQKGKGGGVEPMGGLGGEPKILPHRPRLCATALCTQGLWPPAAPQPPTWPSRSVPGLFSDWFLSAREGSLFSLSSAWHVVPVSTTRGRQCSLDSRQALAGPSLREAEM